MSIKTTNSRFCSIYKAIDPGINRSRAWLTVSIQFLQKLCTDHFRHQWSSDLALMFHVNNVWYWADKISIGHSKWDPKQLRKTFECFKSNLYKNEFIWVDEFIEKINISIRIVILTFYFGFLQLVVQAKQKLTLINLATCMNDWTWGITPFYFICRI